MAQRQSNAAYDFEIFEQKPPKSRPTLSVVGDGKVQKQKRLTVWKTVFCAAVVVSVICVMLYYRAQLTMLTSRVSSFEDTYADLKSENTRLNAELESRMSLRGVEERAKELGMNKVQGYQVQYVTIDGGNGLTQHSLDQENETLPRDSSSEEETSGEAQNNTSSNPVIVGDDSGSSVPEDTEIKKAGEES